MPTIKLTLELTDAAELRALADLIAQLGSPTAVERLVQDVAQVAAQPDTPTPEPEPEAPQAAAPVKRSRKKAEPAPAPEPEAAAQPEVTPEPEAPAAPPAPPATSDSPHAELRAATRQLQRLVSTAYALAVLQRFGGARGVGEVPVELIPDALAAVRGEIAAKEAAA